MGEHELVAQNGLAPTAKVLAGWVTGSGATIVLGVLALATDSISAETFWGGLTTTVLAGVAAYVQKSRRTDKGA